MNTTPAWLLLALDGACPNMLGGDRDALAARIVEHLPIADVIAAIRESAQRVLEARNVKDGAGDLAREIANNAAQVVMFTLDGSLDEGGGIDVIPSDAFDPAADAAVNAALDRAEAETHR